MKRILGAVAVSLVAMAASAEYSGQMPLDIPAFHSGPPKGTLPPILSGQQLSGPNFTLPYQVTAYKMAAKVGPALYQQPCFCHCDRAMGHQSLHSCFEGLHGAECATCLKEGVYTYQQTRLGKSAAQIRAAIERGEFMNVDLEKIHM